MNLSRPINVLPGTRPPSVLNLTQESVTSEKQKTLTSFYLPHETEKTLCINSATTTRDVIRSLLSKFRIVDNPHKYVLYEKKPFSNGRRRSSETSTVTISGNSYIFYHCQGAMKLGGQGGHLPSQIFEKQE